MSILIRTSGRYSFLAVPSLGTRRALSSRPEQRRGRSPFVRRKECNFVRVRNARALLPPKNHNFLHSLFIICGESDRIGVQKASKAFPLPRKRAQRGDLYFVARPNTCVSPRVHDPKSESRQRMFIKRVCYPLTTIFIAPPPSRSPASTPTGELLRPPKHK